MNSLLLLAAGAAADTRSISGLGNKMTSLLLFAAGAAAETHTVKWSLPFPSTEPDVLEVRMEDTIVFAGVGEFHDASLMKLGCEPPAGWSGEDGTYCYVSAFASGVTSSRHDRRPPRTRAGRV